MLQLPNQLSPSLFHCLSKNQTPDTAKAQIDQSYLPDMGRLAPLSEEPNINEEEDATNRSSKGIMRKQIWRKWIKTHLTSLAIFNKRSDFKVLLSVLGCPLFPVSALPNLPLNEVGSTAQYIVQHFTAATGCRKIEGKVKNIFATGKVNMAMVADPGPGSSTSGATTISEKGCFVMWQMVPNKWLIELVSGGHKIAAGSDGNVAWRHTPWLGAHAAKGGVRPLRRALQGLDPMAISAVFAPAQYMGEKQISGIDCFVLKLSANQTDLSERSDSTAEMIKHVIFGYFSQRNGLLVYLEDSYLTRIQSPGAYPTYWETTMSTKIEDYRTVEEVMIAHSGQTTVVITRFGDNLKTGSAITRLEETWSIDDLAFNVEGLSMDCFIPPKEVQKDQPKKTLDWRSPLH